MAPERPGQPVEIPPSAQQLAHRLVDELAERVEAASDEPDADELRAVLGPFHEGLERFFQETFDANPSRTVRCGRGCSHCCAQWVFDVHACEIEILGRHVLAEGRRDELLRELAARIHAFDEIVERTHRSAGMGEDEFYEQVAVEYLEQGRPCIFLGEEGQCGVHAIRPYACRRFFSLSEPELCRGESVLSAEYRGFMLEPSERVDGLLDRLDRRVAFRPSTGGFCRSLHRWLLVHGDT